VTRSLKKRYLLTKQRRKSLEIPLLWKVNRIMTMAQQLPHLSECNPKTKAKPRYALNNFLPWISQFLYNLLPMVREVEQLNLTAPSEDPNQQPMPNLLRKTSSKRAVVFQPTQSRPLRTSAPTTKAPFKISWASDSDDDEEEEKTTRARAQGATGASEETHVPKEKAKDAGNADRVEKAGKPDEEEDLPNLDDDQAKRESKGKSAEQEEAQPTDEEEGLDR